MIHLKTILHPTDFSEHSIQALEMACALARDQNARVILLHVVPRPVSLVSDVSACKEEHALEDSKTYREEMVRRLKKLREEAPWAQVESLLKEGDVAGIILRTAEENPCDLIVMGTHGRSRMHQLMMGSVAAEVSRKAPCPVVTVKVPLAQLLATEKGIPEKAGAMCH